MTAQEGKLSFLVSFFLSVGLGIGIIYSKYVALFCIFFSNIFFTAYSDAKIVAYLAYTAILFLFAFFIKYPIDMGKRRSLLLHGLLATLASASTYSYIYVTRAFGLPINSSSSFVHNGGFDTTVGLFHIHTFKPVFTWLLTIIGVQNVPYYGSGLTFFSAFTDLQTLYISMFLLLAFAIYLLIRLGIYESQKYGTVFLWVYSIFSYGVVKAIVDGGPLWYETYVNYALFWMLLMFCAQKKQFSQTAIVGVIFSSMIALYFVLVSTQIIGNSLFSPQMLTSKPIVEYAQFLVGFGLILLVVNRKKYFVLILLCFIAGIYFHTYSPVASYIRYGLMHIQPYDTVRVYSTDPLNLPLLTQEGQLYEYSYRAEAQRSVFSVSMQYGHLFYRNVSVEGRTCDATKTVSGATRISIRSGALQTTETLSSPFFISFRLEPLTPDGQLYQATYQYSDCLNDSRTALIAHLQTLGFRSFVLYF